jgi:hypothetical protein
MRPRIRKPKGQLMKDQTSATPARRRTASRAAIALLFLSPTFACADFGLDNIEAEGENAFSHCPGGDCESWEQGWEATYRSFSQEVISIEDIRDNSFWNVAICESRDGSGCIAEDHAQAFDGWLPDAESGNALSFSGREEGDEFPGHFLARYWTAANLEPGSLCVRTMSDDGVRVWVLGEDGDDRHETSAPLIDAWTLDGATNEATFEVSEAGEYLIAVHYFRYGGDYQLDLQFANGACPTRFVPPVRH